MAKLTTKDVTYVAKLASLKLTSKEVNKFRKQLSEVVSYVEELNEVDTSKVKPTSQTTGLKNIVRVDKIDPQGKLSKVSALSGTENVHNGYFVVPAVLEGKKTIK